MAKTVDEAFSTYLSWLTATKTETANAKSHRASIEACIRGNFGLNRFFRTGSFGNGTSVSGFSDVDYFAVIPTDKLKRDSNVTLRELCRALHGRFPHTGVHVSAPAVVCPFGDDPSETTEITPADAVLTAGGYSIFDIPNGRGGWMRSSPELHKAYIDQQDNRLGTKVKPLVRLVKACKYRLNLPISSFYLEMFTGKYAESQLAIVYSIDVRNVLVQLNSTGLAPLQDPMGVSGLIEPCTDYMVTVAALRKLQNAAYWAERAREAEDVGRVSDAISWWDKVFGGSFPAFY